MSPGAIAFVGSVMFVGGFVKGSIGFGAPLVTAPLLSLFFPPHQIVVLLSVSVVLTNYTETVISRREWRSIRLTVIYFAAGLIFVPLGVFYLRWGDPNAIRLLMGLMAYLFLAVERFLPAVREMRISSQRAIGVAVGGLLGFTFGATSITGPINMIYFTMLGVSKGAFIFLMNAFNSLGFTVLTATLAAQGAYTRSALLLAVGAVAPVYCGYWAGLRLRAHIDPRLFFRIIRAVLFLIATSLVARFFLGA